MGKMASKESFGRCPMDDDNNYEGECMMLLRMILFCMALSFATVRAAIMHDIYNAVQDNAIIQRMEVVIGYDGHIIYGPDGKISKIWQL